MAKATALLIKDREYNSRIRLTEKMCVCDNKIYGKVRKIIKCRTSQKLLKEKGYCVDVIDGSI